ncbi:MAG: DUF3574 domain-containing protein [Actinomycetota bacterium]|nr:DUF3574 domain-containing protein [Actinomycetota bacterium]
MERITLHVPETLNDGVPVALGDLQAYETELLEIAGGFTVTPAIGAWRSPSGELHREPLRLYSLDVLDARVVRAQVLELAQRITAELEQEAVYVTVTRVEAVEATGVPEQVPA